VTEGLAMVAEGQVKAIWVEHPTGVFCVVLELDRATPNKVVRAALLRTARLIMRGEVMVPAHTLAD
jgi:4-oxalomesaconate tautomerase